MPFTIQERTKDLPRISDTDLPLAREAKLYEQTYNGQLTDEPQFGLDPLSGFDALIQQRSDLFQKNFDIAKIFGEVTNGQSLKFKQAILHHNNKQALLIFMCNFHAYSINGLFLTQ